MKSEKEIMAEGINKFVFFSFNFSDAKEMIKYIVNGEETDCMFAHFWAKFQHIYDSYGCHAVMPVFYTEISVEYRRRMIEYVLNNYKTEQKL